ncbi:MAG: hypothetical protein HY805_08955 [Nitrospirae bacterium]|nr:hypothetical protein [Nitrospirota bacterium]
MIRTKLIFLILILLFNIPSAYPLEVETHEAINEHISSTPVSGFSLDGYLKNNLGFIKGKDEEINGKKISRLIKDGGSYEDSPPWTIPYIRSLNHFHNPLKLWDKAGLKDSIWGESSILWAQKPLGTQGPGGHYSWHDVRDYFYKALTSTDKNTREKNFAKTFRGIGQLMHLIQDASVPAHTRDDAHIIYNYEKWVEELRLKEPSTFNTWLSNATGYDKSILRFPQHSLAPVPIAKLMDTDRYYMGTNPDITASSAIGISEYSNANFFSEGTIFADFPFPSWNSVEIANYSIPDPRDSSRTVLREYYKKVRDGETGYRLATVGLLEDYVTKYFSPLAKFLRASEKPALDANVYRDYASLLIPRAVGYSAGLLDYFFRGRISAVNATSLINSSFEIIDIRLKIQNNTPNEDMIGGTAVITYEYTLNGKTVYGKSNEVAMAKYIVIKGVSEGMAEGSNVSPFSLAFTFTDNPIPQNAKNKKFWLVYKGRLGKEQGAVAVSLLSESKVSLPAALNVSIGESKKLSITIGNNTYEKDISAELGTQTFIKARFAEGNPFIVGVLTQAQGSLDSVVHLYKLTDGEIIYEGEAKRMKHQSQMPSKAVVYYEPLNMSENTSDIDRSFVGDVKVTIKDDTIKKYPYDLYISNDGTEINIMGSYMAYANWISDHTYTCTITEKYHEQPITYTHTCNLSRNESRLYEKGIFINDNLTPVASGIITKRLIPRDVTWSGTTFSSTDLHYYFGNICYWGAYYAAGIPSEVGSLRFDAIKTLSKDDYAYKIHYTDSWGNSWGYATFVSGINVGNYEMKTSLLRKTGSSIGLGSYRSYSLSQGGFFCDGFPGYFLINENNETFMFVVLNAQTRKVYAYPKFLGCNLADYGSPIMEMPVPFDDTGISDITFMRLP